MKVQSIILNENENLQSVMKRFWGNQTLGSESLENNVQQCCWSYWKQGFSSILAPRNPWTMWG